MDETMTAMVAQVLDRLEQMEQAQQAQGRALEQMAKALERQGALLAQLEENQRGQTEILQQHGELMQEHGEDLLKIKVRIENDIVPKLDMLFEGHVNLAEQRDRDQRGMRRRMRDVEDRSTILTAQVEGLLKAQ